MANLRAGQRLLLGEEGLNAVVVCTLLQCIGFLSKLAPSRWRARLALIGAIAMSREDSLDIAKTLKSRAMLTETQI